MRSAQETESYNSTTIHETGSVKARRHSRPVSRRLARILVMLVSHLHLQDGTKDFNDVACRSFVSMEVIDVYK